MRVRGALVLAVWGVVGCTAEPVGSAGPCSVPETIATLPAELAEASGLAASRQHPGILWTHNDSGGEPVIYAIDESGTIVGRVRVSGARNRDWEDLALGPCPAGACLYIADTGDNRLRRDDVALYRIPEPAPDDSVSAPAERFPLRYPDGPRDVEAVYVLPSGVIYLVSKGRGHAIALFRAPAPLQDGTTVELEEIQRLSGAAAGLSQQVTGADATPDGAWVAIRTYASVQLFHVLPDGRLEPALAAPGVDLQPLVEPQGEAITLREDGTVLLGSEAGVAGVPGTLSRLRCRDPGV